MDLSIKAQGVTLTEDIKQHMESKIGELDKFVPEGTFIRGHVDLEKATNHHKQGNIFLAKANIEVPGKLLHAQAEDDDIIKAINALRDELQQELKKYKELSHDKQRKGELEFKEMMRGTNSEEIGESEQ